MLRTLAFALVLAGCGAPSGPAPAARCPEAPASAGDHQHGHGSGHHHDHDHGHAHGAAVVRHEQLKTFENNGNSLTGVATASQGAGSYEVWRTSVAVGSATPPHRHESEEVFIFLRGKGKAVIGDQEFEFEAPATVIAPPNVPHQFFNTGDVPTDAIVVIGVGSRIWNERGEEMQLPWRR